MHQRGIALNYDIHTSFGPVATLNAALDAVGQGWPCAAAGLFRGVDAGRLAAAVERTALQFPILQGRMTIHDGRPAVCGTGAAGPASAPASLLSFSPSAAGGRLWTFDLAEASEGVWFRGVWGHAIADGLSMLRFLTVLRAVVENLAPPPLAPRPQRPLDPLPMDAWLSALQAEQERPPTPLWDGPAGPARAVWTVLAPAERDLFLNAARDAGGPSALMAASVCAALSERLWRGPARFYVNIPIRRTDLASFNGFGCRIGWLLQGVDISPDEAIAAASRQIGAKLRRMIEGGWDLNFDRSLGDDPAAIVEGVRAGQASAPIISVSWKGKHAGLGQPGRLEQVACFSSSSTCHVSAHADDEGLSLSLSSPHDESVQTELLTAIAARMIGRAPVLRTLGRLM